MLTNTRNIVRLLVVDGEFVLLAKVLKKGFFFLPGGGIEYNEPIDFAARRELKEELSVQPSAVIMIRPIGVFEHSWDDEGHPFHEMNFVCKCRISGLSSASAVESAESHLSFEWIRLVDVGAIDLRPAAFKTLIPAWITSSDGPSFFSSSMA